MCIRDRYCGSFLNKLPLPKKPCCRTVLNHVVRRRRSAAPRSGRRTGRWRCCWGSLAETATPRSSCGSARSASRRRPRNLRVQELRRQASSLLAAEPSRPRLRHRACPSRGHLPSAPGTRGASTRSTSRARCGRACVWRAGCSPGACERALAPLGRLLRRRDIVPWWPAPPGREPRQSWPLNSPPSPSPALPPRPPTCRCRRAVLTYLLTYFTIR